MAITLIAHTIKASTDGAAATTTAVDTTGANLIVLALGWATGGTQPVISDSAGNTWVAGDSFPVSYLADNLYYCINPTTSATHTFTASGTASAPHLGVVAVSGAATSAPASFGSTHNANGTSLQAPCVEGGLIVCGFGTIGSAHAIDSGFSSDKVNFSSAINIGGGIGWLIQGTPATPQAPIVSWTTSSRAATTLMGFAPAPAAFTRIQSTPVLAKGATYNSIVADALASPAVTWDGARWVMTISIWNVANAKWYSIFFTSPDLLTWTYVANSLVAPTGSDYILGNSGLVWWNSKYYWAYSHYPPSTPNGVTLATSTDLLAWTIVGDPINGTSHRSDPMLTVNPTSGLLELWTGNFTSQYLIRDTSVDGITWTDNYATHFMDSPAWITSNLGGQSVWYSHGTRYMSTDGAIVPGERFNAMFSGASSLTPYGYALCRRSANAWENTQTFELCCVGPVDRGDGRGTKLWALYCGSDVVSGVDNTDSSIGLAWSNDPSALTNTSGAALMMGM
jgi:hypothetical protein